MKNGENVWINEDGKKFKSEERPEGIWYPCYPVSRVRGEKYEPYSGNTEWCKAANMAMAKVARSNFESKCQP